MAGRKPLGPALVEHLEGSPLAKERLELILATNAGQITVVEAARQLGISEAMFYKLRTRVLQVALADLEPKPLGRPPEIVSEDAQQQAARVAELERELAAQTVRLELAQVLPHVVQSPAAAALKKNESPSASETEAAPAPSAAEVTPPTRCEEHAARQLPQREREHEARLAAVRFVAQHTPSCRRAARCLRLSPRTLADWRRRSARGELTAELRGRPVREPTREERTVVTAIIEEAGPSLGVPAQRACYPATSRCVLTYLVRSYRQQFQAEHRQVVETLHWQRPGTVWAIDHSEIVGVQVRQTLARQAVLQQGMY